MSEEVREEGHRAFSRIIEQIDGGLAHAEASAELHRLTATLADMARATNTRSSGKLTLTLSLSVEPNGIVQLDYGLSSKEPSKPRATSVFWLTKGNNLAIENPRQTKLPLAAVPEAKPSVAEPPAVAGAKDV